jgi:hypothetical protein
MQRAQPRDTTPIHFQSQATRLLPGHSTGDLEQAVNDDDYHGEESPLYLALAMVGNVFGGSVLLAAMLALPYLIAGFLR